MAKKINVTIDEKILDKADRFAEEKGLSRSALLALAVDRYIDMEEKSPIAKSAVSDFFTLLANVAVNGSVDKASINSQLDSIQAKLDASALNT